MTSYHLLYLISLGDKADLKCRKVDCMSCGGNTYSPMESLLEGGETYKL